MFAKTFGRKTFLICFKLELLTGAVVQCGSGYWSDFKIYYLYIFIIIRRKRAFVVEGKIKIIIII
jgi:hypothetical protein